MQLICSILYFLLRKDSEDPDQMASSELQKPADLDQRCFLKRIDQGSAGQELE